MSIVWIAKGTLRVATIVIPTFLFIVAMPTYATVVPSSALSNYDIVSMVKAGLPPDVVIEEIKTSSTGIAFDTSVEALTELKVAGVPDEILQYMVNPNAIGKAACQQAYSIKGYAGTGAVTIAAGGHSTIAGGDGFYTISGLPSGSYTVRPSKAGCTFSPSTIRVTLPPNALAKNFKANCSTNNNAKVTWIVSDGCGGGIDVFFFDTNGAIYPNGPGKPGYVDRLVPSVFSFEAARGSTLLLGAEDILSPSISWCFGIDGDRPAPPTDTNCAAKVPATGDLVRSVTLTCPN